MPWHRCHWVETMPQSNDFRIIQTVAPRREACSRKVRKHGWGRPFTSFIQQRRWGIEISEWFSILATSSKPRTSWNALNSRRGAKVHTKQWILSFCPVPNSRQEAHKHTLSEPHRALGHSPRALEIMHCEERASFAPDLQNRCDSSFWTTLTLSLFENCSLCSHSRWRGCVPWSLQNNFLKLKDRVLTSKGIFDIKIPCWRSLVGWDHPVKLVTNSTCVWVCVCVCVGGGVLGVEILTENQKREVHCKVW